MKCLHCDKMSDAKRLPPGWHRDPAGNSLCGGCWNARYILRAITIPVAGPVGATWDDFRAAMDDGWKRATALANWGVQELMKADVVRTPDMAKLPKMPPLQLYNLLKGSFEGWSQSAACVLRALENKYRATRYERIWLGRVRLPDTRYPLPFPVHNAAWHARHGADGEALVTVSLPLGKFTLRLRGGHDFRRQLKAFGECVAGSAVAGELAMIRQRANAGDHRNGGAARYAGGAKFATRLMCKMCMWLPREAARESSGTLFLARADDALLVAVNAKNDRLWSIHGDHVRRWMAEHRVKLQHWADDQKREQRPVASFASRREAASLKYRRRMDSATHEFAAQVVGYARRFRFAAIQWVETGGGFAPQFPWHDFLGKLAQKADAAGISYLPAETKANEDDEAETE